MAEIRIDPDGRPYEPANVAPKRDIEPSSFFEVDMRVGRILEVEPFPAARKPAWKIRVDFGPRVGRLWTSAQVTNYAPDELLDRLVIGVVNLGEKRIADFSSQFLLLGALEPDGTVRLLEVPGGVSPGAPVA
jgi:tRNA-binding protein